MPNIIEMIHGEMMTAANFASISRLAVVQVSVKELIERADRLLTLAPQTDDNFIEHGKLRDSLDRMTGVAE